jgi:hypothetical protein
MTVATVLTCMLLGGCGDAATIWSVTSESPDGKWLAVAHTVQYSGPGNDGVETIVEIKETKRRFIFRTSERVLGFSNDGASIGLKLNWTSSCRLEVEFTDDPKARTQSLEPLLYYQVVRTSGVEISVRDLYTGTGDKRGIKP